MRKSRITDVVAHDRKQSGHGIVVVVLEWNHFWFYSSALELRYFIMSTIKWHRFFLNFARNKNLPGENVRDDAMSDVEQYGRQHFFSVF